MILMTVLEINCQYKLTRCKTGVWSRMHKPVSHFSSSVIPSSVPVVHLSPRPYSRVIFPKSTKNNPVSSFLLCTHVQERESVGCFVWFGFFFFYIHEKFWCELACSQQHFLICICFNIVIRFEWHSFCKWSSFDMHNTCKGSINFHNSSHFLSFCLLLAERLLLRIRGKILYLFHLNRGFQRSLSQATLKKALTCLNLLVLARQQSNA